LKTNKEKLYEEDKILRDLFNSSPSHFDIDNEDALIYDSTGRKLTNKELLNMD
jgi:hypothetical protein